MVGRDKMKNILLLLLISITTLVHGQNIRGKVVDESHQPLPFASVSIENTTIGTISDINGDFILKSVKPNSNIVVFYTGYEKVVIKNPQDNIVVKLKSNSISFSEVTITTKKSSSNETMLLLDKKNLVGIESSIGSVEMSKKGISNAEDGLKKVTGITFSNNRLNIRGLDDRYNQVTLNGIPIPSNNSDKKNIDLNLLPIGIMDNIKVKKTYSSDQWSNVSGAQINISSSDIKDNKSISYRGSMNTLTPIPSSNINLQYGKTSKTLGLFFNFNLISEYQNTQGVIRMYNKQGTSVLDYSFKDKTKQLTPSGLLVLDYNKNRLNIKNTTIFINQNNLVDRETFGTHFDYGKKIFTTRSTPTKHSLFIEQLKTELKYDKWSFEGIGGLSIVKSGEDERKQFVYLYDENYQFNNIDKLDNHIFWNQNNETRYNASFSTKYLGKTFNHEFGYSFMLIKNMFDYQQKYFDLGGVNSLYSNINPRDPYSYITNDNHKELWVNNPASKVEGSTLINGGFYKTNLTKEKYDLSFGVRTESVSQIVRYKDQFSPMIVRENVLSGVEVLPFISGKYKVSDKIQFKGSGSITTIRPRFREMVPFIYVEVFAGSKIQGNPQLLNSTVYNSDISFEYFPSKNEIITLTIYCKTIKNPIERVNVATASGRLETYQNSLESNVIGGEVELKKKYKKLTLDYNLSLLLSQIKVSESGPSSVVVTNKNRPLQGSTPLISNIDVFYSITKKSNIGATYNYVGKKLNSVGVFGLGDIYQSPQHFFNLVYNLEHKKYDLSVRVNNIFNTSYILSQKTDQGDKIVNKFQTGQEFSIGLKYKI